MRRVQVFVSGFVQGVGFRQFVKKNALQNGIRGWVRNLEDGRVEGVMQGKLEGLEKMIQLCRKGPFLSEVKNIEVFWQKDGEAGESFEGFEIIR